MSWPPGEETDEDLLAALDATHARLEQRVAGSCQSRPAAAETEWTALQAQAAAQGGASAGAGGGSAAEPGGGARGLPEQAAQQQEAMARTIADEGARAILLQQAAALRMQAAQLPAAPGAPGGGALAPHLAAPAAPPPEAGRSFVSATLRRDRAGLFKLV